MLPWAQGQVSPLWRETQPAWGRGWGMGVGVWEDPGHDHPLCRACSEGSPTPTAVCPGEGTGPLWAQVSC